jgi:phenylacetic acid degradation operon negative regulatory protein
MHARSSLFTMFGEFVHPRGDVAWVGTIIEWMRVMGFSEPAVRAAVSRSMRTGWLEAQKFGRKSYYALTPDVRWRVHRAVGRLYRPLDAPWDGLWRVLVYTIPEERRADRDRLRKELSVLGFGTLTPGVWISPNALSQEALELSKVHGLDGFVEIFEARRLSAGTDLELVARAWDIPGMNARYAAFLTQFGSQPSPQTDEHAFRDFVTVLHEYRKFLFFDPGLPLSLQPDGFLGLEAAKLFRDRKSRLAPRVQRFVEQTFEGLPTLELMK